MHEGVLGVEREDFSLAHPLCMRVRGVLAMVMIVVMVITVVMVVPMIVFMVARRGFTGLFRFFFICHYL
jgi:hypothetical protein